MYKRQDLNPLSDSVLRYNFFDFPVPTEEEEKYDIVALSLVMNYEGSLVNRGAFFGVPCSLPEHFS